MSTRLTAAVPVLMLALSACGGQSVAAAGANTASIHASAGRPTAEQTAAWQTLLGGALRNRSVAGEQVRCSAAPDVLMCLLRP